MGLFNLYARTCDYSANSLSELVNVPAAVGIPSTAKSVRQAIAVNRPSASGILAAGVEPHKSTTEDKNTKGEWVVATQKPTSKNRYGQTESTGIVEDGVGDPSKW